jgi:hypothetical protein
MGSLPMTNGCKEMGSVAPVCGSLMFSRGKMADFQFYAGLLEHVGVPCSIREADTDSLWGAIWDFLEPVIRGM